MIMVGLTRGGYLIGYWEGDKLKQALNFGRLVRKQAVISAWIPAPKIMIMIHILSFKMAVAVPLTEGNSDNQNHK